MAKTRPVNFFLLFLFVGLSGLRSAISARLLFDDEIVAQAMPQPGSVPPSLPSTVLSPAATFPATQIGEEEEDVSPTVGTPISNNNNNNNNNPSPTEDEELEEDANTTNNPTAVGAPSGAGLPAIISFYMHDILGGSHPSARVVTGVVANSDSSGIAFSKPNDNLFPIQGTLPLLNNDNLKNIINNNLPFLAGFNGAAQGSNLLLQNSANNAILGDNNNNNNNQPFVTAGQLPSTVTLQQLMFGSITVVDDQLTQAHELGSSVLGRAQGFYLASSLDGTSQTVALTALFHGGGGHDEVDSISFFGVHRTAAAESEIAVVGGTGKYENASGYARVEMLHNQEDQHTTDGVDTLVHFTVYLSLN